MKYKHFMNILKHIYDIIHMWGVPLLVTVWLCKCMHVFYAQIDMHTGCMHEHGEDSVDLVSVRFHMHAWTKACDRVLCICVEEEKGVYLAKNP